MLAAAAARQWCGRHYGVIACQKYTVAALHMSAQFMEHLVLLTLDDDISLVLLFRLKKESAAAMVATVAATAAKVGIEPPMLI